MAEGNETNIEDNVLNFIEFGHNDVSRTNFIVILLLFPFFDSPIFKDHIEF